MKPTFLLPSLLALGASSAVAAQHKSSKRDGPFKDHHYVRQLASTSATATVSIAATGSTTATATASGATATATWATTGTSIPALSQITLNAATQATVPLATTYTSGATPPVTGAPTLPTVVLTSSNYPTPGVVPATDSDEVKAWLAEIDLTSIPDIAVNIWESGADLCTVSGNVAAAKNASSTGTCWWSCGQCSRDGVTGLDITSCPTKGTWGLTYDDGPSDYTSLIVNKLGELDTTATFFVIGTSALYRPTIVQAEYMAGHQICVHTWSHSQALTTLTNEQIVAELGWGRKIIKDLTGVTPLYMRPPWGDTDDRVRAICKAMNLQPIIWTTDGGTQFDTNDWEIMSGQSNGTYSLSLFNSFLNMSKSLDTGFITLEHDLYQQEVDLGVGYVLPAALASTDPKISVKSVIDCLGRTIEDAYAETTSTNVTLTGSGNSTSTGAAVNTTSSAASSSGVGLSGASASASASATASSKSGAGTKMTLELAVGAGAALVGGVAMLI